MRLSVFHFFAHSGARVLHIKDEHCLAVVEESESCVYAESALWFYRIQSLSAIMTIWQYSCAIVILCS